MALSRCLKIAAVVSFLCVSGCGLQNGTNAVSQQPGALSIAGPTQVRLGETAQYAALQSSGSVASTNWLVNGIPGGNADTGTITNTGLYSPPVQMPSTNSVSITAESIGQA